jgi:hypothetical protein
VCYDFGTPRDILDTFDLNVCRVAWIPETKELIDCRGVNPKNIVIMKPTNYSLLDRILKYAYRDFDLSVETLLTAKALMTSDGLSEYDRYGESTYKKLSSEEYDYKIESSGMHPKVWLEYFKDRDFLSEEMEKRNDSFGLYGINRVLTSTYNKKYAYTDNQFYAMLLVNGELKGDYLEEARDKYPESFL